MAIDEITGVMSPPDAPVETHGITWLEVENQIGTRLPDDYKAFIEKYGSGRINGFIWVFNPFSVRKNINLVSQVLLQLQTLRTLAKDFGEQCPYPLFPTSGGLLPFAMTDNGDVIHWLTEGKANDWKIVVNEARSPRYEEFNFGLTSFLRKILTRENRCSIFPVNFSQGEPSFETK